MTRYSFPRDRCDAESAARARAFAWRGVLLIVAVYAALVGALIWKLLPAAGSAQ